MKKAKSITKLKDLQPDPKNANKHTERGSGMMEHSIQNYGFGDSMTVDQDGIVLSGNQRLETLADLKMDNPIVVQSDGTRPIVHQRVDLKADDPRARALAVAQNRVGEMNLNWEKMAFQAMKDDGVDLSWGWDEAEMNKQLDINLNDGKLLDLTQVTIADPRHVVEKGERYKVGKHILICEEVLTGWPIWVKELDGDGVVFAPYPGPYIVLTVKADKATKVVMVQPDTFICGHILDRWAEIKGEQTIAKQ